MGSVRMARCCRQALYRCCPPLAWLPHYSGRWLRMDALAGLTVGLTVVPQALAYAEIAGLPVQYGLYSSFIGCFVYCLLGTSKDITLGPTAIMSLLVSTYGRHDPVYAVLLAFLCGCIQLALGALRLGFLVDFISFPVINGFTSAAAITIGFGQLKNILGLRDIPRQFFREVYYTFYNIAHTRWGDVVLGAACLLLLLLLQAAKGRLTQKTGALPALDRVCRAIVGFTATGQPGEGRGGGGDGAVERNSRLKKGLDRLLLSRDAVCPAELLRHFCVCTHEAFLGSPQDFGAGLAVVPLVGFLESIAIAKAFAAQNGYRVDPNQELVAIGTTNILGSFFSSYPVTGSFGRTAVNSQTGVCSPAGGLVTGLVVLLSLAFLTPLFFYVPKAALAAVIICAVSSVIDVRILPALWRVSKLDLLPFLASFLGCFWEIQYGILAGIAVSGIILLYNIARPEAKVTDGGYVVVQLQSGFSFPAAEYVRDQLGSRALEASPPRSAVLDCVHISTIDYTSVICLRELSATFQRHNLALILTNLKPKILSILTAAEIEGLRYCSTMETAGQYLRATESDQDECEKPLSWSWS
ncbi:sodium-independent sulfate anion transporter [Leucoraja erinacea]|uniref:sodium-independent sulfate anion transporter n=1 Tax=Leucoraja erinaceus TaxID=7782 RepID=UPI0024543D08|nr:sodium-independent sulfate anion transporter [Leucoraja erinacea]